MCADESCWTEEPESEKGSEGLFGHEELQPNEFMRKWSEPGTECVLRAQDGKYDPSDFDNLPHVEKWNTLQIFGGRAIFALNAEKNAHVAKKVRVATDYVQFEAAQTIGPCLQTKNMMWDCDEAFALQRFQGCNPCDVRMHDSKIVLDHQGLFACGGPVSEFVLRDETLVPERIFVRDWQAVPSDSFWKWRYAKLVVGCAEFAKHELVNHLVGCHLFAEKVIFATMNTWRHTNDVVYRLLVPHFARTLAVNNSAKELLLPWIKKHLTTLCAEEVDELIVTSLNHFDCNNLNFEASLRRRGFDVDNLPRDYYYAQDGLQIWRALLAFVRQALETSVVNLEEVESWATLIRADVWSFDVSSLSETIAGIIFIVTFQHAALNDAQYYFFGYPPNAIAKLTLPIPKSSECSHWSDVQWQQYYVASLPSTRIMKLQRELVSLLSLGPAANSSFLECLVEYRNFVSGEAVDKFEACLRLIDQLITTRNIYTWLAPSRAGRSISR
jgi:hypothetical protein